MITDTRLRNSEKNQMAGTESSDPFKGQYQGLGDAASHLAGLHLHVGHGNYAETLDHSVKRSNQADHRPQRTQHRQHADAFLHLDADRFSHAFHGVARLGEPIGQVGDARGEKTAEDRIVFLDHGENSLEVALRQKVLATGDDLGGNGHRHAELPGQAAHRGHEVHREDEDEQPDQARRFDEPAEIRLILFRRFLLGIVGSGRSRGDRLIGWCFLGMSRRGREARAQRGCDDGRQQQPGDKARKAVASVDHTAVPCAIAINVCRVDPGMSRPDRVLRGACGACYGFRDAP